MFFHCFNTVTPYNEILTLSPTTLHHHHTKDSSLDAPKVFRSYLKPPEELEVRQLK